MRIISIIFLLLLSLSLEGKITSKKGCYSVNPGAKVLQGQWKRIISKKDLSMWAKARGLVLKNDKAPFIDNKAGVISEHGTSCVFASLTGGFYYLAIDLVDFHYKERLSLDTRLIIHIMNKFGKKRVLRSISFSQKTDNPVIIPIPFEYSVSGSITITFRESGTESGAWALWDCYLYKNTICTE